MSLIERVRCEWNGFPGAPGVSTHYFIDAAAALDDLRAFYADCAGILMTNTTIQIQGGGDVLNVETGALSGAWSGSAPVAVSGASGITYQGPVGFEVQWQTATISDRRRIKGRTYFVPGSPGGFTDSGVMNETTRSGLSASADTLIAASTGNLNVWRRPREAHPAWTDRYGKAHAAITARAGLLAEVTRGVFQSKACVLRSRRD